MTGFCYDTMKRWIDVGAERVRSSRDKDPARLVSANGDVRNWHFTHMHHGLTPT